MKKLVILTALAVMLDVSGSSFAETTPPSSPQGSTDAQVSVVGKTVERPKRVVKRRGKLSIPSRPSVGEVRQMIEEEAALWGVPASALERRARCESGLFWRANNGQYNGVLQFAASTFYRGIRTIGTLKVVKKTVKYRRMHSRVYWKWSTGRVTRTDGRVVRQKIVTKLVGKLSGSYMDARTQLRIGAQALRGISAVSSSEWSCGA